MSRAPDLLGHAPGPQNKIRTNNHLVHDTAGQDLGGSAVADYLDRNIVGRQLKGLPTGTLEVTDGSL
jgi:hypothetical protein